MAQEMRNTAFALAGVIGCTLCSVAVVAQQSPTEPVPETTAPAEPAQPQPAAPGQAPAAAPAAPGTDVSLPPVEIIQQEPTPQPPSPPQAQPTIQAQQPPPQQATPTLQQVAEPPTAPPLTTNQLRVQGDLVRVAPIAGSEIPVGKVPGTVTSVPSQVIEAPGSTEVQDVLVKHVPGIILGDAGGNDLRAQIDDRGFGAGSLNGFPQGLAVYQNGVRINEVFGDTVNWDVLPKNRKTGRHLLQPID